jgi:hypothetical protein
MAEEQIKQLQVELTKANQVHADYLAQKQENVVLKETIDRLRFDLDDLRSAHATESSKGGSSAPGSAMASLSRTLGSELLRRLNPHDEEGGEESDNETTVDETVEKVENTDGDEDVIQTIITRKRVSSVAISPFYLADCSLYRKLPRRVTAVLLPMRHIWLTLVRNMKASYSDVSVAFKQTLRKNINLSRPPRDPLYKLKSNRHPQLHASSDFLEMTHHHISSLSLSNLEKTLWKFSASGMVSKFLAPCLEVSLVRPLRTGTLSRESSA